MNTVARLPSSFPLHREHETMIAAARRYAADRYAAGVAEGKSYAADNYTAGVAEGWRQARKESDAAALVYLIFGTCFGVLLAVVAAGVVL